jgi:hypothetical protein
LIVASAVVVAVDAVTVVVAVVAVADVAMPARRSGPP